MGGKSRDDLSTKKRLESSKSERSGREGCNLPSTQCSLQSHEQNPFPYSLESRIEACKTID